MVPNEVFADKEAHAVVGDDVEGFYIVVGLAGHHGVDAAGVVADHAADGAAVVSGGVGGKGEVMLFRSIAQAVKDDSRLYTSDAARGIDLDYAVHIAGKIENDGYVAALSGERSASAAAEQRRAEFAAERNRGENVIVVARQDDANGHLTIVGAVGRVESAGAAVEADISLKSAFGSSAKLRAQSFGQARSVGQGRFWDRRGFFGFVLHGPGGQLDDFLVMLVIWILVVPPMD